MTRSIYLLIILIFVLNAPTSHADIVSADIARAAGDYETAIAEYTSLAQTGNDVAQATLGYMLYVGEGISQDYEAAVRWYRQAAQQGNADAQYNLAVAYAFGEGVEQNFIEAVNWYTRAAEQDHAIAQYSLGLSYTYGEGVEQNAESAAYWLSRSAENGYVNAQVLLGSKFHTGNGVPLDYPEAARWYALAAQQGDAIAQFNLGSMYRSGTGVTQNLIEARRWYQMSSDQAYEPATVELNNIDRTLASSMRNTQQQAAEIVPIIPEEVEQQNEPIIAEPVEEYVQEEFIREEPTTETFTLEEQTPSEPVELSQPTSSSSVVMADDDSGLLDIDTLDASLPEESSSISDVMLASDNDLAAPENESRGFFSRLFSRSTNNQDGSGSETLEVPVEDYSTGSNEAAEVSQATDLNSEHISEEIIDVPDESQSSGGFFSSLFRRQSSPDDTNSVSSNEESQQIVEMEQADQADDMEMASEAEIAIQDESVDTAQEQQSGGLFGSIFGRRSSTETTQSENAEQIAVVEQDDIVEQAPSQAVEMNDEDVSVQAEESSSGFFGRLFGKRDSADSSITAENDDPIAMIDEEVSTQSSLSQSAEVSIDAANNTYEQGIFEFEQKNYGEAAEHFQSAAAQGSLMAQYRLATLYYQGLGKEQNYALAALWYRRAAEQGNVDAQYSLGNMYLMGEGIPQDDVQARYWYKEAADQGHEAAQHNVANIDRYSQSNTVITKDIAEEILGIDESLSIKMDTSLDINVSESNDQAAEIMVASLAPATSQTIPSSLATVDYERGLAYSFGEGVAKNLETAFEHFMNAAKKDYVPAQYKVGVAYAYAEGTMEDKTQAVYWYDKAAMKGHTIAQRNLGVMYEHGDGINEDKVKALAWYNILAQSGNVMDIRRRDTLSDEMNSSDISEADRLTIDIQDKINQATQ